MGLIATTIVDNRRAIRMSDGARLLLNTSNMQLMGSTVFIVFQWDNKPIQYAQIMDQILSRKDKAAWVLANSIVDNKIVYTLEYNSNSSSVRESIGSAIGANYQEIAILGFQIQQKYIMFLYDTNTMSREIKFPVFGSLEASDDAEGLSIRGNRFLYEVRIYPPNSVTKENMNAIWQEIHATYHT
jgi:hypothetical protein